MDNYTTLCWRCNAAYLLHLPCCIECNATNPNIDQDAAYAEMLDDVADQTHAGVAGAWEQK